MMNLLPTFDLLYWVWHEGPMGVTLLARATALLAASLVANHLLARFDSRWRRTLWRVTFSCLLALPFLLASGWTVPIKLSLPAVLMDVHTRQQAPAESNLTVAGNADTVRSSNLTPPVAFSRTADSTSPSALAPHEARPAGTVKRELEVGSVSSETTRSSDRELTRGSWMTWCLSLWLVGIVVAWARLLPAHFRLKRLIRDSTSPSPDVQLRYDIVARRLGIGATPRLRISDEACSPMLVGLRQPTLMLPGYVSHSSEKQQEACLAHELSHFQNDDIAWGLGAYLTGAALWFHPLAWLALRAHDTACEESCDAQAAEALGSREHYARCLAWIGMEMSRRRRRWVPSPLGGMAMARLSNMMRRLAQLRKRARRAPLPAWKLSIGGLLSILALVALAGLEPSLANANEKIDPAPAPAAWIDDLTPIGAADWTYDRAAHLLERAGFGGTPEEIQKLADMTPQEAVDYLVDYEKIPGDNVPPFDESGIYPHGHKVRPLQEVVLGGLLTGRVFGIKATQEGPLKYQPAVNEFYTLLVSEHGEMNRAGQWWAQRMLTTPRPFEEKMTLFWHDHFATSQEKLLRYEKMIDHIDMLREHALADFRSFLVAVAQDPAMLVWLDNKDNVKGKPNENFAREIMELFTLGEGQGYTEDDIREMARAFTGWTTTRDHTTSDEGKFVNNPKLHDDGEKTFLGETGRFDGYDAIDIILKQPAASRYVSGKIYRYFVRENLSKDVHEQISQSWRDANFELKPLMNTIFLSRDFYSSASVGTQIKTPVHFLVSTYRKFGIEQIPGVPDFNETSSTLGQVLFYPPNVAGWADGQAWINPATLLTRGNFVEGLLFGDAESYGAPDKVVVEGYRKIPLMFPEYDITPRIWSSNTQRMEPVSMATYDRYVSGLGSAMMMTKENDGDRPATTPQSLADASMKQEKGSSKMSQLAESEDYNLAVGVYTGFVRAYDRVKPIERTTAAIDLVALARAAGVDSTTSAVDSFCRRFLRVPLPPEDREAIIDYLRAENGGEALDLNAPAADEMLRRTVHLILSSPEYQLG